MKFSNPNDWQIWAKSFPLRAAADAKRVSPFTVLEAKDVAGKKTRDVLIYGQIGRDWLSDDGVDAAEFAGILAAIPKNETPRLRIKSPGGNVWEGFAIYNLARERGCETINDGVAASIAAVILCAGNSTSPESASVMIHKCYGMFIGNSDAVAEFQAQLDKHDDMQVAVFAKKTGRPAAEIKAMMSKDKWFNGIEAKAFGLIDSLSSAAPAPTAQLSASQTGGQPQPTTNENNMKKTVIVALLALHGILNATTKKAFTEADADADFEAGLNALGKKSDIDAETKLKAMQAQLDLITARAANDGSAALNKIQARLDKERANSVSLRLDKMAADCKLTASQVKEWLPKCIADESDELLAMLEKNTPALPGSEPAGIQAFTGGVDIIEKVRGMKAGAERRTFLIENFASYRHNLDRVTPRAPGMSASNTIDTLLVPQFLADALVVVMQNKLAMADKFARRFEMGPIKKQVIQVKKAVSGATGQQDPTDFEATPDSNLDNIPVTPHQESLTFQVSNDDRLNGIALADLAEINAETFANQLSDRITAVITTANYGTALVIGTAAAFDTGELKPVLAVAKNYRRKNLILDGGHLAYIQPSNTFNLDWRNGAFGFDSISEHNRWTGATDNTVGFVSGPDAMALVAGMSVELPTKYYESLTTTVLKNGIPVQTAVWFTTGARKMFCCFDNMFGVGPGDTTQAELLVTQ